MAIESDGASWPEQDAAIEWWNKHRLELCSSVSDYRIQQDRKLNEIREICLMEGPPPGADSKMILIERVLGLDHGTLGVQEESPAPVTPQEDGA